MTQEEKRIKIAEACGWKSPKHPDASALQWNWTSKGKWWLNPDGFQKLAHDIPDYFNDLNACHKAWRKLDRVQHEQFKWHLVAVLKASPETDGPKSSTTCAGSQPRAEALFRTFYPAR